MFFDFSRGFNVGGFGVAASGFLRNLDRFLMVCGALQDSWFVILTPHRSLRNF